MVGSFRSVVGAAGLALAFSLAAVPGPANAEDEVPSEAEVLGGGDLVTDTAGNALMVGTSTHFGDVARFRYRHANGHWSRQYDMPGLPFANWVGAAAGRPQMPVVAARPEDGLLVTIRRPGATWTRPYDVADGLAGTPVGVDVVTNPDGDYAVSWTQREAGGVSIGKSYVAIKQRFDRWRTFIVGGRTSTHHDTVVGMDAYGNVTVGRVVVSTGETQRRVLLRTRTVEQGWQPQLQVSSQTEDILRFDLIIERTGRQTVALHSEAAQVSERMSRVLRQAEVGAPLAQVWSRTAELPGIGADGGRLRIAWASRPAPDAEPVITTQVFDPDPGAPTVIEGMHGGQARVAIDRYGSGAVSATLGRNQDEVGYLFAVPVSARAVGDPRPLEVLHMTNVSAKPALGAGRTYFVGVVSHEELPAGWNDYTNAYRLQRP